MTWTERAQSYLSQAGLAGWLIYDFRGVNPVAAKFLELRGLLSRRIFFYLPTSGQATLIVHAIEAKSLGALPYTLRTYSSRQSLRETLAAVLPRGPIAMEYSPQGDIPYVSHVDAGALELVRALGAEVVSSADLLQQFAAWTPAQLSAHQTAVRHVEAAKDLAFEYLTLQTQIGQAVRETDVQQVMVDYFRVHGLEFGHAPIVAFGAHSGDPHYAPQGGQDALLQAGDAIMIDVWCKLPEADAPYADITWMGVYGEASAELTRVFQIVTAARDLAVVALADAYQAGRQPAGFEIDRLTRGYIAEHGFADAFIHRTGHSLGSRHTHGDAVHLDDYETHDSRLIVPGVALTVEPGIYLDAFGVRSEINLYMGEDGPQVTTAIQRQLEVIPLPT
jgi:Xaa-Pro aminopeptidase